MPARKYTEEELEAAYQLRKIKSIERAFRIRQEKLKARFDSGEDCIKLCGCGKYYDERVHNNNFPGAKRTMCTNCPLRPLTRIKKVFNIKKQAYDYIEVPR